MNKKILLTIAIFCCLLGILGIILTPPPYSSLDMFMAFLSGSSLGIIITSFFIKK